MKFLVKRDKKRRLFFSKKEKTQMALKYLYFNRFLSIKVRFLVKFFLGKVASQNSSFRFKSRCVYSFRSRSILRNYRCSRIIFRNWGNFGKILGLVKNG